MVKIVKEKLKNNKRGISLIEVVISMAVFTLILVSFSSVIFSYNTLLQRNRILAKTIEQTGKMEILFYEDWSELDLEAFDHEIILEDTDYRTRQMKINIYGREFFIEKRAE